MSLIVGNCLFSFVQECHIHDFFMKRCSGRVKVKLNLNTRYDTPRSKVAAQLGKISTSNTSLLTSPEIRWKNPTLPSRRPDTYDLILEAVLLYKIKPFSSKSRKIALHLEAETQKYFSTYKLNTTTSLFIFGSMVSTLMVSTMNVKFQKQ